MNPIVLPQIWFVCGSQHLYGPGPLRQVARHAKEIVAAFSHERRLPLKTVFQAVVTTPEEVTRLCAKADADPACAGLIFWMHTFSPAKMWIRGLTSLRKPFLHLHTQFHRDLPWESIDMDYMNLHQSAHGDREAGHLHTRLRRERKVVVGHWSDPEAMERVGTWMRAARAWHDWQGARFVRFGDNMRQVAVTEGDKVSAEIHLGFSVDGHGIGDLVARVEEFDLSGKAVTALCDEYEGSYRVAAELRKNGTRHQSLREAARIELGLRAFLEDGGFKGFTDTFEDLGGLRQLPGIAVQRLMADGYGFGAEGDWKTAALLRAMKVMGEGNKGGTSFMEDYTYHLEPGRNLVLGAHMLEVCPTIAAAKPSVEVHPLGIGKREDPVRLVFDARPGAARNASLVDLGNRFRLLVAEVTTIKPPKLPHLPVARALWKCQPDFKTACAVWIYAGGAHHTAYSQAVSRETLEDFSVIANLEIVRIGPETRLEEFRQTLRVNEVFYHLNQGFHG